MYPVAHAAIPVVAAKAGERRFPARWLPLDYRCAALGGLLPDLIDKPIAWYLYPSIGDDHLWGHSIWLPVGLMTAGLLIRNPAVASRLFLLGLGALTHLIFDPVASDPGKLFWPFFGSNREAANGYIFLSPLKGQVIDLLLLATLLASAYIYEPVRRRVAEFGMTGAI